MSDRWLTAGTVLRWHFDTKSAHEIVTVFLRAATAGVSSRNAISLRLPHLPTLPPPPAFVPVSVRGVFLFFFCAAGRGHSFLGLRFATLRNCQPSHAGDRS